MLFRRPMFLRRFRYGYSEFFPLFFITYSLKLLIAAERQQARGNQKAWDGEGNTRPLESANKSLTRHHRLSGRTCCLLLRWLPPINRLASENQAITTPLSVQRLNDDPQI